MKYLLLILLPIILVSCNANPPNGAPTDTSSIQEIQSTTSSTPSQDTSNNDNTIPGVQIGADGSVKTQGIEANPNGATKIEQADGSTISTSEWSMKIQGSSDSDMSIDSKNESVQTDNTTVSNGDVQTDGVQTNNGSIQMDNGTRINDGDDAQTSTSASQTQE